MATQDVIRELDQKLLAAACESVSEVTGNKIKTVAVKKAVIVENFLAGLLAVPADKEDSLSKDVFDLVDELNEKLGATTISDALAIVRTLTAELATSGPTTKPPKAEKPVHVPGAAIPVPAVAPAVPETPDAGEEAAPAAPVAAEKPAKPPKAPKEPKPPKEVAGPSNLRILTAVICENIEKPRAEVMELVKALELPVLDSTINAEYANVKRVWDVAKTLGLTKEE
jgi:hypothetical protein